MVDRWRKFVPILFVPASAFLVVVPPHRTNRTRDLRRAADARIRARRPSIGAARAVQRVRGDRGLPAAGFIVLVVRPRGRDLGGRTSEPRSPGDRPHRRHGPSVRAHRVRPRAALLRHRRLHGLHALHLCVGDPRAAGRRCGRREGGAFPLSGAGAWRRSPSSARGPSSGSRPISGYWSPGRGLFLERADMTRALVTVALAPDQPGRGRPGSIARPRPITARRWSESPTAYGDPRTDATRAVGGPADPSRSPHRGPATTRWRGADPGRHDP